MRRLKHRARLLALIVLAFLLSGCVSIPDSGPVLAGPKVPEEFSQPRGQFYASPPTPGAIPQNIVAHFFDAGLDFRGDHDVAREYLTSDRKMTWRPLRQVLVRDGQTEPTITITSWNAAAAGEAGPSGEPTTPSTSASASGASAPSTSGTATASTESSSQAAAPATLRPAPGAVVLVSVELPVAGRVSGDGLFSTSEPGDTQLMKLTLRAEAGEWRIADAPDGIVLQRSEFDATYVNVPLYFPDLTGAWLVPDMRWLPQTSTPTAVVSALLRGPSLWLRSGVRVAAPPGTALSSTGVSRNGERLVVDLNVTAQQAQGRQRQLLSEQIQATLTEASRVMPFSIANVRLTAEGSSYEIPLSETGPPKVTSQMQPDTVPIVIDGQSRLARLSGGTAQVIDGLPPLPAGATRPAMSRDSSIYAYLSDGQSSLITVAPNERPVTSVRGESLTAPSVDSSDWVWTASGDSGVVIAVKGDKRQRFEVPWLRGLSVTSLRISPEGARALITVTLRSRSYLLLTSVSRDDNGVPSGLGTAAFRLAGDLHSVRSADWLGDRAASVLASPAKSNRPAVFNVALGGGTEVLIATLPDAQTVTSGWSAYQIWAESSSGTVQLSGSEFVAVANSSWPAVPG